MAVDRHLASDVYRNVKGDPGVLVAEMLLVELQNGHPTSKNFCFFLYFPISFRSFNSSGLSVFFQLSVMYLQKVMDSYAKYRQTYYLV